MEILENLVDNNLTNAFNTSMESVELEPFCAETNDNGSTNLTLCTDAGPGTSMASPVCMFITGVVGNLLALGVLHTTRKELRKTPYFILLLGLAWTDLISQLMTSPVTISVYANGLKWQGGKAVCIYSAFVMIAFGIILPVIVFCLSVERLLALKFTYLYSRLMTVYRAKWIFVICWISVIFFCSLPLMGFGSYEHQYPGTWCFLNFHNESVTDSAYASIFSVFNIFVIIGIVLCNSCVVLTLLKMRKRHSSPRLDRRFDPPRKSLLQMEMETQMVWFLCAVTLVFVACWLPLNIHILINLMTGSVNYQADLTAVRFASINQILDPWLYILLRKSVLMKISKLVRKVFKCQKKKRENINLARTNDEGLYEFPLSPAKNNIAVVTETEANLQGLPSEVYVTCESNGGLPRRISSDSNSSDSDQFLDANSSRCFPIFYDSDKPRFSVGYFSSTRYKGSMRDNSNRKKLCRMLSLPTNIRT